MSKPNATPPVTSCDGCGQCCRNQPFPPFLWSFGDMPPDWAREELARQIVGRVRSEDDPCLWLAEDGTCSHYDERPEVCRDFEMGGEGCLRQREALHQIGGLP